MKGHPLRPDRAAGAGIPKACDPPPRLSSIALRSLWRRESREWVHNIAIDSKGNLYTAEVGFGRRVQKFNRIN